MRTVFIRFIILGCGVLSPSLPASSQVHGCVTLEEYEPVVVANPDAKVTFRCDRATPFDVIRAVGRQTRHPIGVVIGRDSEMLNREQRRYDLRGVDGWSALEAAIQGTGYSLRVEKGVWEVIGGDVSPRQNNLLMLPHTDFRTNPNSTAVLLGSQLTMWMSAAVHPEAGYAASILGSTNDEQFTLAPIASATTEEIADRIVSLGSKGLWILRSSASNADPGDDAIEIEPYQHYSNRAKTDRPNP